MDIRPIKTEDDYNWALAEIAPYFEHEPEPGSPDGDRFDVLAGLIEVYENKHWRIEAPDPVETIKTYMVTFDRSQSDLATLLGSRSRASEILKRNRRITLDMVYTLHDKWKIPADLLVAPYHLAAEAAKERRKTRKKSTVHSAA